MNTTRSAVVLVLLAAMSTLRAQDEVVPIPGSVLDTIGRVLPERSNAGSAFLAPGIVSNLVVVADCEVRVVFAWENAGYRNSLGWFRWGEAEGGGVETLESGMLFPDVERTVLPSGTARWLVDDQGVRRQFHAGDRIGFFIVADGEQRAASTVGNWRHDIGLPASDPSLNRGLGRGLFTTIPEINPEADVDDGARAGHVALVRMPGIAGFLGGDELLLLGFEDLDRTSNSDDDFNDCVFLVDVQPAAAIDRSGVTLYDPNDRDGDGVAGVEDAFPDDPERAWVRRVPAHGYTLIAFEDFYPATGDRDFNDAVVAFAFTTVADARNRVTDLIGDFHLVARGASYDHEFGLRLPELPGGTRGSVSIERFRSGAELPDAVEVRDLAVVTGFNDRIDRIFASTQEALPRAVPDKPFANTWPGHPTVPAASARVWIRMTDPVRDSVLGPPPYDPFLFVTATDGTRADVHLPGFPSFDDRSPGLPRERGSRAFLDALDAPFAILVPTNWRHPLESVPIEDAYPQFETWRDSRGRDARSWYDAPSVAAEMVSEPVETVIPLRAWTLRGPGGRF